MRGRIPNHFVDDLLRRIDIVAVIEARVPLKRAGREWSACCPFHDERTPSFYVSPVKQFYHCFGCGAHGSAIKFLMDYEHLDFQDAVEELAASAGMQIPRDHGALPATNEDRSDAYTLLEACARWYQAQLPGSTSAQAYCMQRDLTEDIMVRFRVGYAPDRYDGVMKALGQNGQGIQQLREVGMLSGDAKQGKNYDRFRNRLMFPILDRRGRVIAFGGRALPESTAGRQDAPPKYLNSPETALFHKGRELFGFWQVKQGSTKLTRIIVVEGLSGCDGIASSWIAYCCGDIRYCNDC